MRNLVTDPISDEEICLSLKGHHLPSADQIANMRKRLGIAMQTPSAAFIINRSDASLKALFSRVAKKYGTSEKLVANTYQTLLSNANAYGVPLISLHLLVDYCK